MTFFVEGDTKVGGVATDGVVCVAYDASRFGSDPTLGTAAPGGSPDGGPVYSGSQFGGTGHYKISVPNTDDYWVGSWLPSNPSQIAWEKKLPTPHTTLTPWTGAVTHVPAAPTTVAAASNGAVLPTGTINVASLGALPFPTSGTLLISASGAWTLVSYTGKTTGSFTGCTGGSGTLSTGDKVLQAFIAGNNRILLTAQALCKSNANGDSANIQGVTTRAGVLGIVGGAPGLTACVAGVQGYTETNFPCDPQSPWGLIVNIAGTGSVSGAAVEEIDF